MIYFTIPFAASILLHLLLLPQEARGSSVAAPLWRQSQKVGNTTYFLFDSTPPPVAGAARIERHDLATRQWLPTIHLPTTTATAFVADDQHIYVGHERAAYRYDLDGTNRLHMLNTILNITEFQIDGDLLFLILSSKEDFISINKSSNVVMDFAYESYSTESVNGTSIARSKNRIIGRSADSDNYIDYLEYDDSGMFVGHGYEYYSDNNYDDYYYKGIASPRTFMFPDESRVMDHAGNIFGVKPLGYRDSIDSMVVDVEWLDSGAFIVLDDKKLLSGYTANYLPTGGTGLGHIDPRIIRISEPDDVLAFSPDHNSERGIRVDVIPLPTTTAQDPPPDIVEPLDPQNVPFTPDSTFLDKYGVLYLFSKSLQSVFRWDVKAQLFLSTIPLDGFVNFVAYSAPSHVLYTATWGAIQKIDLSQSELQEEPFATLDSSNIVGFTTAGARYIFASTGSGTYGDYTHHLLDENGIVVNTDSSNYRSDEYVWSDANQKMYHFGKYGSGNENDYLYAQPIDADGNFGYSHYFEPYSGIAFVSPISIKPDGSVVILGSGSMHDPYTLVFLATALSNGITDIAFLGNRMRTVRSVNDHAQFQEWLEPSFEVGTVFNIPGTAHRLLSLNEETLVGIAIGENGVPSFYVMDASFKILPPAALAKPTGLEASTAALTIDLSWNDISGEDEYVIERLAMNTTSEWTVRAKTPASRTAFSDYLVLPGEAYSYRVVAKNGMLTSPPSEEITVLFEN